jgi:hypothetical protein
MKRIAILCLLIISAFSLYAEVSIATVDGMKVTVLNINLKKQGSEPIGASSPEITIDLTEELSGEAIGSINIEDADQYAHELSFDFSNIEIPLKAYSKIGTDYYYTTISGIAGPVSSLPETWTNYDYLSVPKISPDRPDGRVVVQSYFPQPVMIATGSSITITGLVDLDYCVLLWDGDSSSLPSNTPFAYNPELYPAGTPAFAVGAPDIVLGMNTTLNKETYAFSTDAANLNPLDIDNSRIAALFFDADGNLYDGAGKYFAGYSVGGSAWARAKGTAVNSDGTYNLEFARNYDESLGNYYYDISTDNSFRRMELTNSARSMTVTDWDNSTAIYHYIRIE